MIYAGEMAHFSHSFSFKLFLTIWNASITLLVSILKCFIRYCFVSIVGIVTPHFYGNFNIVMIANNEHCDIYLDCEVMAGSWLQIVSCLYFPGYIYLVHNIVNVLNTEVSVVRKV